MVDVWTEVMWEIWAQLGVIESLGMVGAAARYHDVGARTACGADVIPNSLM